MKGYTVGVDIGSGSIKETLLDADGRIAAMSVCEYPTYYEHAGWAEQDPEDWCRAFGKAWADLLDKAKIRPEQIQAMAIDAATHTAVLLDENNQVIRRSILWTDQRSVEEVNWLKENLIEKIRAEVCNEPTTVWTLPQFLWIQKHEPEVWGRIRHILFAKDYLRFRLNGELCTDSIDAMGSMFFDAEKQEWGPDLCAAGRIDRSWLPEVRNADDEAAGVIEEAAEEFGVSRETRLFVGTTDTVMEMLAAGNVEEGDCTVKLATAGRICVIGKKPIRSPFVFNYRHVIPGLWYPGTATSSCAASYRWYRNTIGRESYEQMNAEAAKVPAGCDGLMFHPYLQGELTPYNDPLLRACYSGISSACTTAHFTRATLEGAAFSLRDCFDLVKKLGMEPARIRIIGGGAKGLLWRQIVADTLGEDLEKVETDDSSFGSAMLAAKALGWFGSYQEAAEKCIKIDSRTVHDPENTELYSRLFVRYRKIHQAIQELET